MSKLTDLQDQLGALRKQKRAADLRWTEGKARHQRKRASDADLSRLAQEKDSLGAREAGLLGQLAALGDPRKLVEELDDGVPFVLFPVRIETRFVKTTPRAGTPLPPVTKYELLVRIYPDDCQVQTFTDFISESELRNVRRFWMDFWKAGGVVEQQRSAWRGLVAGHGSGRAAYLVGRYQPTGSAPAKAQPHDVFLVVSPAVTLTPAQRSAAETYWAAHWRAGKDAAARAAARQALLGAVGQAVADSITTSWRPHNLADEPLAPHTRASVDVSVITIDLPPPDSIVASPTSWQQAPRAVTLPDRFVVTGVQAGSVVFSQTGASIPSSLHVGPDPSLPDAQQIKSVDGELHLNQELRWLTDFDQAVARGMGMRVPLTQAQYEAGFDRLTVLGLRLSSDAEEGAQLIEALLRDHHASKSGLALLPQGTPTNNTDEVSSGYSWLDDPDASFDGVFGTAKDFPLSTDANAKRDGQWLAELLGIDVAVLRPVAHAGGTDQADARAMNRALWPTTWGYFLDTMLDTEIDDATIERVRSFFIRYVSGRGAAPALRIGKQPYGILPATVRSRLNLDPAVHSLDPVPIPFEPPVLGGGRPTGPGRPVGPAGPVQPIQPGQPVQPAGPSIGVPALAALSPWPLAFLNGLQSRLDKLHAELRQRVHLVPHVGQAGLDPQQLMLDILGLNPASVEYYQRYLQSMEQYEQALYMEHNSAAMPGSKSLVDSMLDFLKAQRDALAVKMGLDPQSQAPMLDKVIADQAFPLTGPVIDDVPLSETAPIRPYAKDGKNYLAWLATSLYDAVYKQDFGGNPKPKALLYLIARHAVLMSYWDASVKLLAAKNLLDPQSAKKEPEFLNVGAQVDGKSKFEYLINARPEVTGEPNTTVAEFLDRPAVLKSSPAAVRLREVKDALAQLAGASTSRLERLFAEHIDLCSYRLDAWRLGLVHHRLAQMRGKHKRGAYLGAFGLLEKVRPENKVLTPAPVPDALAGTFVGRGRAPIMRDASNAGYIHAPSINHATAAAILRNAYITHATAAEPGPMSINLSSARVRAATGVLEGMQRGQGLAELLGYQFERGLHDAHNLTGAEVEGFMFELRGKFPLGAGNVKTTKVVLADMPKITVKHIQARNVIDGLKLLEHVRQPGKGTYPFGFPTGDASGDLPVASPTQAAAINAEVTRLKDTNDAVADLMMAESVFQAVQGQSERAAAATDVIGKGARPHEPEVVRTPRSGMNQVHRVVVHLDAAAPAPAGATPRAAAEPALEAWLRGRLPAPADVACAVSWSDPGHGAQPLVITQADLGLGALDLVQLLPLDPQQGVSELDDRIEHRVRTTAASHPATVVHIHYTQPVPGKVSFFELAALVRALRPLVLGARALSARDATRAADAGTGNEASRWDSAELIARVNAAIQALGLRAAPLAALAADSASATEPYLDQAAALWLGAALHGVPQTGTGAPRGRLGELYRQVADKITAVITRWQERQAEYDALLAGLAGLASDADRLVALAKAEALVSTSETDPLPDTVAAYQAIVAGKRSSFDAALAALQATLSAPVTRLADFFQLVEPAAAAIAQHDPVWLDIDRKANDIAPEQAALAALRVQVAGRVAAVHGDILKRTAAASALLAQAQATADSAAAVKLAGDAARKVLGDSARLLPRFTMAPDQGDELASAWAARTTLLADLVAKGRDFPVDDWLYGVARVREAMARWDKATVLAEALGRVPAELTPLQLPFVDDDRWTALELPDGYLLEGEKLLYTAHFTKPFDDTQVHCGLVLDEWTEVVPGKEEVTGVAFHFDQPSTEPVQTILLVAPPMFTGKWRWADLSDSLSETLDEAKVRGIEPEIVCGTFGQFLPAALMVVTKHLLTMATNLFDNNP